MLIAIIYRVLVIVVAGFVAWELFSQKDAKTQANAAFVLIPLLIRALMIA